jgi:AraC family transcriptional regulator
MSKPSPGSHVATLDILPDDIPFDRQDLVRPYLSSAAAGWEGLIAEAFHEPRRFEGWLRPVMPEFSLTLITGGPMYLEWRHRHAQRSWTGVTVHHGDLILRPTSLIPYEMRWWSLSTTPTQCFNLAMPQEALAQTAEQVAGEDPAHLTLVERAGFQDPLLQQLALAVRRELQDGAPGGKLFAHCTVQLISLHLLRHYTALGDITVATESSHRLTARQLQRVVDRIQDQPGQELTLEVLAQQAGFSPFHFARLFRQTTGESPHQFVLRQRLDRARHLLEASDAPVAQVAAESGFADQSHFTRVFKRYLGVTPRTYRLERRI